MSKFVFIRDPSVSEQAKQIRGCFFSILKANALKKKAPITIK
jgi:hypothetical protein